jgi:hypothetical protein
MINTVHPDGGFHKWGYPNSWSVYSGKSQSKMDYSSNGCTPTWIVNDEKNLIRMDDDWGYSPFYEPSICCS